MRLLRADALRPRDRHHLMLSTVLPRPIAWVMSMNEAGTPNLAPFSYFNGSCATPPLVSISITTRRSGEPKDTRRNVERTREFVIHVVDEAHAHQMVETSADLPPDASEVEAIGLKTTPSTLIAVPRLADVPVAMECRLVDVYEPPGGGAGRRRGGGGGGAGRGGGGQASLALIQN
jgi:flavin reductase (DIM6/NTAB) family NADH-FMN oxidoreductase RutF